MFACEQYSTLMEVKSDFLVVGGLVAAAYVIYICTMIILKLLGRDLNGLVSNKLFVCFVGLAARRCIWVVLCVSIMMAICGWMNLALDYILSLRFGPFEECTTIYFMYGWKMCVVGVVSGLLLYFATRAQRFHIPLGKFTSLTTAAPRKYFLHLNGNIEPWGMAYVYARNSIKNLLNKHAGFVLVVESWLLAQDAVPPIGIEALKGVYSTVVSWRSPDSGRFVRGCLMVFRFIAMFVLVPVIYKKYRDLQLVSMTPSRGIQLIVTQCASRNVSWSYKKTPFFQLLVLTAIYPERMEAATGCSGVVVIEI
ncbi:hypothetical protein [Pseudomonas sp. TWP3-1]|uniref:hypothetical protein n=1 Tax=Pseudomonas sp. TWP3-1 TaxID=2804631 RepID=UPI003CEF46D4